MAMVSLTLKRERESWEKRRKKTINTIVNQRDEKQTEREDSYLNPNTSKLN